jgi:hypothetical protein
MKISIEIESPEDFPIQQLNLGEIGILTFTNPGHLVEAGDVVICGESELIFPKGSYYTGLKNCDYRCRRLRPGERIIFKGE